MGAGEHKGLEVGWVHEGRIHGDGDGWWGPSSALGGLRTGGGWRRREEREGGEARDLDGCGGHGEASMVRERLSGGGGHFL